MQYVTTCMAEDCDYKYRDPSERSALNRLRGHIDETGHEIALQGEYDSPRNGGIYSPDGHRDFDRSDFSPESPL